MMLVVEIDATAIVEAYRKGFEDCFVLIMETEELDEQLNINGIDTNAEGV